MIQLYTIFHGNLQFSSIPKNKYKTVIDNCYWPLIRILDKNKKIKLGIEFSGLTLLEIQKLDKKFIDKIKKLIKKERLEFIGSSYTQTIFPLIPYEVNLKNLKLGIQIYKKILGFTPKIFYVNEQTFSDGLISLYKEADVNNIVVDFDSTPDNARLNKSLLYRPAKIISQKGEQINVIWNSSIAFQKFQRYIFDEISYEDYLQYLSTHFSRKNNGSFCLYGGDWEVFGFSPKGIDRNYTNDFRRINNLFESLTKNKNIKFILPINSVKNKNLIKPTCLTDFSDPILCKKQEKYNVSRWALAGKKTVFRNTDCFRLFREIIYIKKSRKANSKEIEKLETSLVKLWASDYRTNTTDDKNKEYEKIYFGTRKVVEKYIKPFKVVSMHNRVKKSKLKLLPKDGVIETPNVKLTLDWRKGATIKELIFPKIFTKKIAGLVPHGHFQNPKLSPDWLSAYCVFEAEGDKKYTDLSPVEVLIDEKFQDNAVKLQCEIKTQICTIKKTYFVYKNEARVDLRIAFNFKRAALKSARIGSLTFDPLSFDMKSFWYSTVNGGNSREMYYMGNKFIAQEGHVSFRISSRGCLGATEGWLAAGDSNKGLALNWDQSEIASCPAIHFEKTPQGLYGQIHHSIGESDETGYSKFDNDISTTLSIIGFKKINDIF